MSSPAANPTPPPDAVLIRRAREARGLSPESAAAQMDIRFSGSRWRQIEAGYRKDIRKPVVAKAAVLAHMARVVGVSAERLDEAGRSEAAEVLREIGHQATEQQLQSERIARMSRQQLEDRLGEVLSDLRHAPFGQQDEQLLDEGERLFAELRKLSEEHRRGAAERPGTRHAG